MPDKKRPEDTFWKRIRPFELQRIYIVFGLIYFPIALLFLNRGTIAEILLIAYTFVLMSLGALMIVKFLLYLSKSANENKNNYGSLLVVYFFNGLIPLAMFKVFGYVFVEMLPKVHKGFLCDIKYFIVDILYLFRYQQTLDYIIMGSLVLFVLAAVWSVGRRK